MLISIDLIHILRLVDRQLLVVRANAVALLVSVGENACLQHLIWGEANTRHDIGWIERHLLNLRKEIAWVAVEHEVAHIVQRVILLGPDLGYWKVWEP